MKRVGIIGGGQLAWMMGDAAKKLNVELVVQTPNYDDPAVAIATETVFASIDDAIATALLAEKSDVITFENEFVNLEALSPLAEQGVRFRPRLEALTPLLDKYHQLLYLQNLGLPVPKFFALEQEDGRRLPTSQLSSQLGFPLVLKARRHGYDGQGTFIFKDQDSLKQKLEFTGIKDASCQGLYLLEEFIPYERELAVIAARSVEGEVCCYPVVETQQEEQVCRRVIVPAQIPPELEAEIKDIAGTLLNSLEAVGVFGIEFFLTSDRRLLVNEIAPRTHNSGHFSLDACETSQFEQHLRAVCGLSLGSPALHCAGAVMVNILGYENSQNISIPQSGDIIHEDYSKKLSLIKQITQAHVHWYGKNESRPGRKLGHITVLLDSTSAKKASAITHTIESIWYS
ncbi:MAG: 5-(carboxyamino)imidazole ribonucleotide synthase [Rhizonema sp. PD38]|nr:5-(carboxyamino)imidazole ribonucleotide synthase [Rhizonema sp. PD38]